MQGACGIDAALGCSLNMNRWIRLKRSAAELPELVARVWKFGLVGVPGFSVVLIPPEHWLVSNE